jgi:osmotically-inducible protein OsmY
MSLGTRVTGELHVNRKFRRVVAYTSGGTVTLVGKVFDDNDKLAAARTAGGVSGVTKVVNDLATDEQEWAQKQARIQQELQNAGLVGVTVKVIGSDAYLSGEVKTTLDRDRAVTVAQAAAPVTVRTNLIRVAPGNVFGF